jgi:hypothetical protein
MKRGQKRSRNQKRRDARALRLIQTPPSPRLDKYLLSFIYHDVSSEAAGAACRTALCAGTKADLITLKLWS